MSERKPIQNGRGARLLVGIFLVLAAVIASFTAGMSVGRGTSPIASFLKKASSETPSFALVEETWNILQSKSLHQPLDETKAIYAAVQGLVDSLGDPYTVFFDPEASKDFEDQIQGTFEGIGAEIGTKDGRLVVIAPLKDSPAEKAGLASSDEILQIDGTDTEGMSVDDAVSNIRGAAGTTVTIRVKSGDTDARDVPIVRASITIDSVIVTQRDDDIAEIAVTYFGPKTTDDLLNAIQEAQLDGKKALLLDLRSNPGGLLESAIDIAGTFFAKGTVIVKEVDADGTVTEFRSEREPRVLDWPVAVLVDSGSASASEIVAGALQDGGRATIVGVTTFGKGTVQELETLPDGSDLKVTIAEWLTPKGRSINENGITPDVAVSRSADDVRNGNDPQRDRAVGQLRDKLSQ